MSRDELNITQADRDAAADHIFDSLTPEWMSGPADMVVQQVEAIRDGEADESSIVQAFARHRIAALSQDTGFAEGIEAAAKVCDDAASLIDYRKGEQSRVQWNLAVALRDNIRSLLPSSPVVGRDE